MSLNRKTDHLNICLQKKNEFGNTNFNHYRLPHQALPEINFSQIDLSCQFLGKKINYPILISSMTGGTPKAQKINQNLAKTAQDMKIAMAVGSQRIALEKRKLIPTFQVRKFAADIVLLSNLGAVQLNYGLKHCLQAVKMIQADGLIFHLNPLQEAIQPEGNKNFSNLLKKIQKISLQLKIPIIVKEVGCGISQKTALSLFKAGIKTIDVGGWGGTNWALIEGCRRKKNKQLGKIFSTWGIPTADAILQCSQIKGLTIIAGGGIRTGIDIAKAIALGADLVSLGLPLLQPATQSSSVVKKKIANLMLQLKIAMFCLGVKNIKELKRVKLLPTHQFATPYLPP